MARTRRPSSSVQENVDVAADSSRVVRPRVSPREEVPYQAPSQPVRSVRRPPSQPSISASAAPSQPSISASAAPSQPGISASAGPSQQYRPASAGLSQQYRPASAGPSQQYRPALSGPSQPCRPASPGSSQPCRPSTGGTSQQGVIPPFIFPVSGVTQLPPTELQRMAHAVGQQQPFMSPYMQTPMMGGYTPFMAPQMWQGVPPPVTSFEGGGYSQSMIYPMTPFPFQPGFRPFCYDPAAALASSSGGFRPTGATGTRQFTGFQSVLGTYDSPPAQPSGGTRAQGEPATPTGEETMPETDHSTEEQGEGPTTEQLLFENPYLEACAAKVTYYTEEVEVEVPGQPGVTVGGVTEDPSPVDDVVDDGKVMTEDEEMMLAESIEPTYFKQRGGGIGVQVPPNPSDKRPLTLCRDGSYGDPRAVSLAGDIVRRVMRNNDKFTYRNFTKEEKYDAWASFQQHYQWDKDDYTLIKRCFDKIGQKSFQDGMNKAKKWWILYKTNRQKLKNRKLWMTEAHLKNAIVHWRDPATKERSRKARENRLKRKGSNYVGGSIGQGIHRERLAEKHFDGNVDLVPQSAIWLKTHCKVLPDKTQKWTSAWARKVYLDYLRLCVEELGPDPTKWEPINMKQWLEASGGAKKGFVPGFSTCGDAELVGFEVRKYPKFINRGGSKEAVQKAAAYIVQLQLQNAAQEARISAQNKHIKELEEHHKNDMRAIYNALNMELPERYREEGDVGGVAGGVGGSDGAGGVGGSDGAGGSHGHASSGGVGCSGSVGGSGDVADTNWFDFEASAFQ